MGIDFYDAPFQIRSFSIEPRELYDLQQAEYERIRMEMQFEADRKAREKEFAKFIKEVNNRGYKDIVFRMANGKKGYIYPTKKGGGVEK